MSDNVERHAALVIDKLAQTKCIGGKHVSDQSIRQGALGQLSKRDYRSALKWLDDRGMLVKHGKGALGNGEHVSIRPDRVADAVGLCRRTMDDEDVGRLARRLGIPDEAGETVDVEAGGVGGVEPRGEVSMVTPDELSDALDAYLPRSLADEKFGTLGNRVGALDAKVGELHRSLGNVDLASPEEVAVLRRRVETMEEAVGTMEDEVRRAVRDVKDIAGSVNDLDALGDTMVDALEKLGDWFDWFQRVDAKVDALEDFLTEGDVTRMRCSQCGGQATRDIGRYVWNPVKEGLVREGSAAACDACSIQHLLDLEDASFEDVKTVVADIRRMGLSGPKAAVRTPKRNADQLWRMLDGY